MDGWIKVHRKILDNPIFSDPDLLRLWIYCLAKASFKETTVIIEKQEVNLLPGQFITGRFALNKEFNLGLAPRKKIKETTLWSWLKRLETYGNLDIKSYSKYSVVTVVKWVEYQESLTTEPQQTDNRLTTEPQQTDTNKNVKNLKNDKKEKKKEVIPKIYFHNSEFVSLSQIEYDKLIQDHGIDKVKRMIEILDNYKGSNNKKYASDYRAILNWVVKRVEEEGFKGGGVYEFKGKSQGVQPGGNKKESEYAFLDKNRPIREELEHDPTIF